MLRAQWEERAQEAGAPVLCGEQGGRKGEQGPNCYVAPPHIYKASYEVGHSCRGLPSSHLDGLVLEEDFSMTGQQAPDGCVQKTPSSCFSRRFVFPAA